MWTNKGSNLGSTPIERMASEQMVREDDQKLMEKEPYVERPKRQRILAWVLAILVIVGVLLYFGWISGILK